MTQINYHCTHTHSSQPVVQLANETKNKSKNLNNFEPTWTTEGWWWQLEGCFQCKSSPDQFHFFLLPSPLQAFIVKSYDSIVNVSLAWPWCTLEITISWHRSCVGLAAAAAGLAWATRTFSGQLWISFGHAECVCMCICLCVIIFIIQASHWARQWWSSSWSSSCPFHWSVLCHLSSGSSCSFHTGPATEITVPLKEEDSRSTCSNAEAALRTDCPASIVVVSPCAMDKTRKTKQNFLFLFVRFYFLGSTRFCRPVSSWKCS